MEEYPFPPLHTTKQKLQATATHLAVPYHQTAVHPTGTELGGTSSRACIHRYLTVVKKEEAEHESTITSKSNLVVVDGKDRRGEHLWTPRYYSRDGILMNGIQSDLLLSSRGPLVQSLKLGHGTITGSKGRVGIVTAVECVVPWME